MTGRYTYDKDILHELQNIVLDKNGVTSLQKEYDCLHVREFEIYIRSKID